MRTTVSLESLLSLLPPSLLEDLAVQYKIDAQHEIRLPGNVAFVCMLNGLVNHPVLTQRLLEDVYHQQTGQHADYSTFSKYLTRINPAYFRAIFDYLYERLTAQSPQKEAQDKKDKEAKDKDVAALRLRFVDATIVTLSAKLLSCGLMGRYRRQGAGHRQIKSVVELSDDGLPNLLHICRETAENSDCFAIGAPMQEATQPGDFWIFDKGCHDRERFLAIHESKGFWLTPHSGQKWRTERVLREYTLPVHVHLGLPPPAAEKTEQTEKTERFHLVRVEQVVFNGRPSCHSPAPRKPKEFAARLEAMPVLVLHAVRYDERSRKWKPLVLMTNLPLSEDGMLAGSYTFDEVVRLYQRRWEIETFFKFIKQHLGYSHLTSRHENGIRVMIYMSLIAALLLIWYKRQTGIDRGWKSVKFWFAENLRSWTQTALQQVQLLSG